MSESTNPIKLMVGSRDHISDSGPSALSNTNTTGTQSNLKNNNTAQLAQV
jgi:hypothetical protein